MGIVSESKKEEPFVGLRIHGFAVPRRRIKATTKETTIPIDLHKPFTGKARKSETIAIPIAIIEKAPGSDVDIDRDYSYNMCLDASLVRCEFP
jgi:hypothetical protein